MILANVDAPEVRKILPFEGCTVKSKNKRFYYRLLELAHRDQPKKRRNMSKMNYMLINMDKADLEAIYQQHAMCLASIMQPN